MHSAFQLDRSFAQLIKFFIPLIALACVWGFLPSVANATGTISITSGPADGGATNLRQVAFGLSYLTTADKEVDFYCSLDNEAIFFPCQSVAFPACPVIGAAKTCIQTSRQYSTIAERNYAFRAFAVECDSPCDPGASGIGGPMVVRNFSVDRVVPTLALVSGPSSAKPVIKGKPTFVVSTSETASLRCSEDGSSTPLSCASPIVLEDVTNGRHTLSVTALDLAGNTSTPLVINYKVDVLKPKKCKKGKSKKAKAKHAKCKKSNAKAKALWNKQNR